ncbi:MAG TPA: hypothetical protein VEL76_00565 [Gemmataceae bacterium]|nr:hypothetical protein [Gemmataceae bacterium]
MRTWFTLLAALVASSILGAFGSGAEGDPAKKQGGKFKITTRKPADTVEIQGDLDRTVFVINSPSGIGGAVIERLEDNWPKAVVLRLRLRGLENFRIANGKVTLAAAVSVREGKVSARRWQDDKENVPLDEKSPYWMEIRAFDADGKPAAQMPLKGGYIELTLPRAFLEGKPRALTLNWIDFYRG